MLARYCQQFDTVAICDEVWEHVVFDGREHIPLITIPGMRDRTIKVGSAGKIFSLTGWKVGFVCAAPPARSLPRYRFLTFTTAPAGRRGLGPRQRIIFEMRRDLAEPGSSRGLGIGFPCSIAGHGFHRRPVAARTQQTTGFCKRIVTDYKVAAIPVSAFTRGRGDLGGAVCFQNDDADTALSVVDGGPPQEGKDAPRTHFARDGATAALSLSPRRRRSAR